MAWIHPIIGAAPSSPDILETKEQNCEPVIKAVEKAIQGRQFLVGDSITIADIFVISGLQRGYEFVSCAFPPFKLHY